ncbi:PREDICTED: NXPE family member 2-like [Nanorana parkeri]|uniref:NXPE family member 2-like n=1 Tax=Nanorana parkeri TaxID=125878 RepID=UPI000854DA8F|nr:PREDICTED: NXPE family member 2-like [Nanorana parkeri]
MMELGCLERSNIGVEIPKNIGSVDVQQCNRNSRKPESKCKTGEDPLLPSGYFFNTQWNPANCKSYLPESSSAISKCLSGKMIYFMGDSTLRQWIEYMPKVIKTLKFFDMHGMGNHRALLALDLDNHLYVKWKKHGHPFVTHYFYTMRDFSYIAREIDQLAGGSNTVIAITLGQHFRPFPITLFIKRLLNIRKAIENLFKRSPDTTVILKTENTREINPDVERFSDFHGYSQYLLMKEVFLGLNVGVIDAWDMTTAFGSYDAHPAETIIQNQINMLLSFIC